MDDDDNNNNNNNRTKKKVFCQRILSCVISRASLKAEADAEDEEESALENKATEENRNSKSAQIYKISKNHT